MGKDKNEKKTKYLLTIVKKNVIVLRPKNELVNWKNNGQMNW